jgi:hypothetical protein
MPHAVITLALDEPFLVFPAIGGIAGAIWTYRSFLLRQRKRLILKTPASTIRDASMGLLEVSGVATGPYVILSALKKAECYYHRSVAWEWKKNSRRGQWVKVAEEILYVPFYVDDRTDKVLIDARGADTDLHRDFDEHYNRPTRDGGAPMPANVSDFLVRHGADPGKPVRVEEYCIKPGNLLFVLGTLSQNPGIDASIAPAWAHRAMRPPARKPAPARVPQEIIRLSGEQAPLPVTEMTQQQKIAAALTKAGMHDPKAWTSLGQPSVKTPDTRTAQVAPSVEEKPIGGACEGYDLHPPVVLMQGTHEPAFCISWRSQRDVVNSPDWKSALLTWGGPALLLSCAGLLLWHLIRP